MTNTRKAAVAAIFIGGLAFGGSVSAMQPNPITPSTTPDPSDVTFVLAFGGDDDVSSDMNVITDYMDRVTDAADDMDFDAAALWSGMVADTFSSLLDSAREMPGADGPFGQQTILVMTQCAIAWQSSSDAIDAFDFEALDTATDQIEICTGNTGLLADRVDEISG